MKKVLCCAIFILGLGACYTPLNNSGVATTKPWLEIPSKKTDFDGKQYDSCYQFNVRFWPPQAAEAIDLQETCISACCWRSDKEEVTLDFNKNLEHDLATYGRAYEYTPGQITLKVNHANWINTTRVSVSPKGVIHNNGLIKLKYKVHEDSARMVQVQQEAQHAMNLLTELVQEPTPSSKQKKKTSPKKQKTASAKKTDSIKRLVQQQVGTKIDNYFYQMNKQYNKQGATFLLSERLLYPQPAGDDAYIVSCQARARTGLDSNDLNASTFSCGQWWVDVPTQTVTPYDKHAKMIWNE